MFVETFTYGYWVYMPIQMTGNTGCGTKLLVK
jgi:hypothetical protein